MNIVCVGGGPAGLYFAILMKKAYPDARITVRERNRADDTFGWGVVFSKETLGHFGDADAETYAEIRRRFAYWDDIDTFVGGSRVTSTGHGFCGMSRMQLLTILQERAAGLGVELSFEDEVADVESIDADLVIGGDGVNSALRERYADVFRPTIEWGRCRFTWLGTTLPLESFTFLYRENEHGLFAVHSYPFQSDLSTFIVECHEETWRRAGLDEADEAATVRYCEELFRDDLRGHPLLTNRSIWRSFPTIRCERWHHGNLVLMGDAVHTAHFSIGSGTKLAMEDAIALVDAFRAHGTDDVPKVLEAYQEARWVDVAKLQRAAAVSRRWFENVARYKEQDPIQFTFNQTTRSKRITWDNLETRDPAFVARTRDWYAEHVGAGRNEDGRSPVPMFTPFRLRDLELRNRVVVSPMCMYSADDGLVNDWHLVHLGTRAIGGAGLVITEMTDVTRDGRISPGCAGMYRDEHVDAWRRITGFVHRHSDAKIAIQLAHAGRKGSTRVAWEGIDEPLETGNWPLLSASPIPYLPHSQVPKEMDRADMDAVTAAFVAATERALAAGFDMIELHMAHGYLLSSFVSPLTNVRRDEYGGDAEARMRYPLEVFDAVRAAWPRERPISVRISASDWVEDGGLTEEDAVTVARLLRDHGCDVVDVSAGQTTTRARPVYGRMFQVPFSDRIRHEVGVPTMTVGNIQDADQINTILAAGRADLCVLARPHLKQPYLTLDAAARYEQFDQPWPPQYDSVRPRPS
ncbi:MAG: bifunctional salicylyl-CoA 5-hydroxylase/oxidoreductase [Planctomycetota bacterium JB042]